MSNGRRQLKILLSAYACEPDKGSEPAVGWNWAIELSKRGHMVWVITRSNNREAIETAVRSNPQLLAIHFHYFDLGRWARRWKKAPAGIQIYYLLWQFGATKLAKQLNQEVNFDLVHHVTFVGLRQPSFMGALGIPFIFGPVAGGESAPFALRRHFGWRAWFSDLLRDLVNKVAKVDPLVQRCLRLATKVFVTSEQTRALLPTRYHHKTQKELAIGLSKTELKNATGKFSKTEPSGPASALRVLYVGQFIEWKGMGLGIQAFSQLLAVAPNASLTMIGNGRATQKWKVIAQRAGVSNAIHWLPWLPREQVLNAYLEHDVLLFPSLHDSGGMVVLEAMACGLPVVCLAIGGPAVTVDGTCGFCIPVSNSDESDVITKLATALIHLQAMESRQELSEAARQRAKFFSWERLVPIVYGEFETASAHKTSLVAP